MAPRAALRCDVRCEAPRARGALLVSTMWSSVPRRLAATWPAAAPPMRVAIVGAGPSGFYAAARVLHQFDKARGTGDDGVEVHMYERLPTPFGLVRYGVAPDHPDVRVRALPDAECRAQI